MNGGDDNNAEPLLRKIIERTPAVVERVTAALPQGFSQEDTDKVLGGLLAAARALEALPAA